jgi:plasmid maintenance system antidote protein VapI
MRASAESWMNMQQAVDLWRARNELNRIAQIARLAVHADGKAMTNWNTPARKAP